MNGGQVDGGRPSHPLRWFPEFLEFSRQRFRSQGRVLAAAMLVGVVAGFGGVAFSVAGQFLVQVGLEGMAGYRVHGPAGEVHFPWLPEFATPFLPWMLLLVPTIGGLLSGYLVFCFAPEAEGHGTDAAIAAYHSGNPFIRPRVPLIKLLASASAITIGTGGSGGREGPIAQIGAGFGSLLGTLLWFRPAERRILLAAGMGAGIAAIFRAPLAGTLFAAEILYWSPEFEPEVILPTGLACVVAYCTFGVASFALGGTTDPWHTLFATPPLTFSSAWELGPYMLLAVWMAVLSMVYVRTFYGVTNLFHRLPLPRMFKPAVGAFLTGAAGLALYTAGFTVLDTGDDLPVPDAEGHPHDHQPALRGDELPGVAGGGRRRTAAGVVVLEEVHVAGHAAHARSWLLAADLMRPVERGLRPEDRLDQTMEQFVDSDLLALPVEDPSSGHRIVGMVRRSDVASAYLRHLHGQKENETPAEPFA